jgi:hypothetical protein
VKPTNDRASRGGAWPCERRSVAWLLLSDRRGGHAKPRGEKSAYTTKQKRKAAHIEEGYREEGLSEREAERRAWATVNKQDGGGKLSGSGRARSRKTPSKRKKTGTKRRTR